MAQHIYYKGLIRSIAQKSSIAMNVAMSTEVMAMRHGGHVVLTRSCILCKGVAMQHAAYYAVPTRRLLLHSSFNYGGNIIRHNNSNDFPPLKPRQKSGRLDIRLSENLRWGSHPNHALG
jgi:hypothetical protein